ncbi:hypothetical protein Tco_1186019 [Tanacetum coccineum]
MISRMFVREENTENKTGNRIRKITVATESGRFCRCCLPMAPACKTKGTGKQLLNPDFDLQNLEKSCAIENVIENESHFSLEVVDKDLSSLATFIKHFMGEQRKRVVSFGFGEGKQEFMGEIEGGSFAICSMVAKDGLGGDGFVVEGGRSPSTSSKDREDGGVANKSSMGSRLVVTGELVDVSGEEVGVDEVNGGGVVLGVSKQFSFELVFIRDSGR